MNVNLTPRLETFVKQKVASGLYNNASEVVREALRIAASRDELELLRSETAKGFAQLREGKTAPLNMAKARRTAVTNSRKGRAVNPLVQP
jgi:antitoxin ParD1/3/4